MPIITFKGAFIQAERGTTLRDALLDAELSPHNGRAQWFNCKGFGSCGTCAVKIVGDVHDKTRMEQWRLDFPPHDAENGLRLACQVRVESDLLVTKHDGFWGQDVGVLVDDG